MIITSLARYPTRSDDQCASVNVFQYVYLFPRIMYFFSPCTYLYRNLILYSSILIGPLKPSVYRYTVKNIPIGCHKQTNLNLNSTCLDPKKYHEEFTGGVLQKVLSGSTLKLGGIKNRPKTTSRCTAAVILWLVFFSLVQWDTTHLNDKFNWKF